LRLGDNREAQLQQPKCCDLFDNPGNLSAIGSHFLPPERRL